MKGGPTVYGVGLFHGVRDTGEPYDDQSEGLLGDASNLYLPDPQSGCGAYARPGLTTSQSLTVPTSGNGQGVYAHRALDGTIYNFYAAGGKLWRQPTDLTAAPVDVTPTSIIFGTGKFVTFTSLADELIVSDGVNKPWRGTNLGATPITATVIELETPTTALSIGSNDVRLANAAFTYTYRSGVSLGQQATFAANATGTSIGALGQIAANTWGIILVELQTNTGALTFTAAFNAGAGYATEALAIAALPARTATRWYVGYVTVRADAGAVWIANTDAFAGGSTGNQAQTTNYYAGEGAAWSAFGQPVIYYGALFFILQQWAAAYARTTIVWSEPNQPGVGYQQSGYDNVWTLTQTGADPLFALGATNDALYYFRRLSIGAIAGAPGVSFESTATHDVVSGNVGCVAYATVKVFQNMVYFADQNGRPYRFVVGGTVEPIWLQCRRRYDLTSSVKNPAQISANAYAVVEPNLNIVLYGTWPLDALLQGVQMTTLYAFDAVTGIYLGVWYRGAEGSTAYDAGGLVYDANGQPRLALLGFASGTTSLPVYVLEGPTSATWTDNAAVPVLSATSGWLGYDGVRTFRAPQARVMQETTTPTLALTVSPVGQSTNETPTATAKALQTFAGRAVFTLNGAVGRGVRIKATAQTAASQWRVYRIEIDAEGDGRATVADP